MTVHNQPDYQIRSDSPAPADYPGLPVPDTFSEQPFLPGYKERRQAFFEHILRNPAPENTKAAWHELARLEAGGIPHEGIIEAALDFIDARKDCADFVLHGILRLLEPRQNAVGSIPAAALSGHLQARLHRSVLAFKYFPDEPGLDSLCTWTENHYILYTSAAYLAGGLYPDQVFSNSGQTGQQKQQLNRPRILRWLDLRFHTGFSEWLSHVYYDEDLTALLALYDYAADPEIHHKAGMVIDLLLFDMALNSFKGVFGSTHGRAYDNTKKWASNEGTTDTSKLLFGMGVFSNFDNMSAIAFALSSYRMPKVIEEIACACTAANMENRQRMGIKLAEMERWGLHPDNFEDGMLYLTLEAYLHPRTITNTIRMFDTCNWWENSFLSDFKSFRRLLKVLGAVGGLPALAHFLERDVCRNTREQVNLFTYKTPDYMLSCAQDYRQGYGGDQQHIWQATLGPDAVCFTTHPAKLAGVTPNYWAGSGLLPRAAQYHNVTIVVYCIRKMPALYVPIRHFFTHAWLPKDKFDEVIERDGWVFARKAQGYLALRSQNPYVWGTRQADTKIASADRGLKKSNSELIVDGRDNIWICQMGRQAENGSFTDFMQLITIARLEFSDLSVRFDSPGNGLLQFGWEGPLLVAGAEIPLSDYPRYGNPWSVTEFGSDQVTIAYDGQELCLGWQNDTSKASDNPAG